MPPLTLAVALPSWPPLQLTFVLELMLTVTDGLTVIVTVFVFEQPEDEFVPVTV